MTTTRAALASLVLLAGSACTPRLNFDTPTDAASGDAVAPDAPGLDAGRPDGTAVADGTAADQSAPDVPAVPDAPDVPAPIDAPMAVDVPMAIDAPTAIDAPDVPASVDVPMANDVPDVPRECSPGVGRACYVGPGSVGVGRCRSGSQLCSSEGTWPTACTGAIVATAEECGNAVDDDCDGMTDEGCRVLDAFPDCAPAMFSAVDLDEEFDSAVGYAARWTGSYVAPRVSDGALLFGPHPLSANWWENYSPTGTNRTFGDAALCARMVLTPANSGDNTGTVEFSLRGGSEGMVVSVRGYNGDVFLQTRRPDGSWIQHATAPLAFARDVAQTVDVLLVAEGNRFRAEVRNVSSGVTATLRTQFTVAAVGQASMVGWMLRNPARVERLRIGRPSAEAARVLGNPDY